MTDRINYEMAVYMYPVKDREGREYFALGRVTNEGMENTLAVTPKGGHGETMFFFQQHNIAYGLRGACLECRMRVVAEPIG